jgi:hypothetical protein
MKLHTVGSSSSLLALALALSLQAATAGAEPLETSYQYSVKTVCSLLGTFGDGAMAQGTYRTLINVGNPTDTGVSFAVTPVVAGSLGQGSGGIEGVIAKKGELAPGGALSIDCFTVSSFFCPTAEGLCFDFSALDGFVRINSPVELDVTAIYTARPSEGEVATMDVESAAPRQIDRTVEVSETSDPRFEPRMNLRGPLEAQ